MTAANKLKPGDTLFWVPDNYGNPRNVTIEKVGRKWLTVGRHRVHAETLVGETPGYGRVAQCYLSEAEHRALIDRRLAWGNLRRVVANIGMPPKGLSTDQINQMREAIQMADAAKGQGGAA